MNSRISRLTKRVCFLLLGLFFLENDLSAQSQNVVLTSGDGWYRIIIGGHPRAGGNVRVHGGLGNNRITMITLHASFMGYDQKGSIEIVENLFYNNNHIDSIRCGSIGSGLSALDFHFIAIAGTPSLSVEIDGINLSIDSTPAYQPTAPTGMTSISGRVIGISSDRWPVYFGNTVGIGTSTPSEKLEVNGTIRSKEVKVEAAPWPDYVFAEDYNLKSLEETEAYIKENNRLPDMPSAEEVAENGIALGEMNRLLLEKVEELTLYVIELKKENQQQDLKNSDLLQRLEAIADRLYKGK